MGAAEALPPLSRSFHLFLWTRFLGTAANQMLLVGLGWQMYDLTSSAWDLGLVGLFQFIPAVLLTIPAGQLADRVDRRAVLGASLALQAVAALLLGVATWGHWIGRDLILFIGVMLGAARALQAPAQQALVPSLVQPGQLPRAMAMSSASMKMAVIGGPAVGGFVYALGAEALYAACVVMGLVSLGFVATIQHVPVRKSKDPVSWESVFAGVGYIWHHKVVLGAISMDLFAVVLGGATALLPIFARDVLHTGPWGLGLLRSAMGVGGLIMAIWLARHPLDRKVGRTMFACVAVYGLGILAFAFSTEFILSFLALAVSGAADMISIVIRQTLVQLETPDEMRGRVSAVNATFIGASNQLGEFRAGALAEWLGPIGSVVAGAVGTLIVVALWIPMFPALARRDKLVEALDLRRSPA
jgi:MFS family permease